MAALALRFASQYLYSGGFDSSGRVRAGVDVAESPILLGRNADAVLFGEGRNVQTDCALGISVRPDSVPALYHLALNAAVEELEERVSITPDVVLEVAGFSAVGKASGPGERQAQPPPVSRRGTERCTGRPGTINALVEGDRPGAFLRNSSVGSPFPGRPRARQEWPEYVTSHPPDTFPGPSALPTWGFSRVAQADAAMATAGAEWDEEEDLSDAAFIRRHVAMEALEKLNDISPSSWQQYRFRSEQIEALQAAAPETPLPFLAESSQESYLFDWATGELQVEPARPRAGARAQAERGQAAAGRGGALKLTDWLGLRGAAKAAKDSIPECKPPARAVRTAQDKPGHEAPPSAPSAAPSAPSRASSLRQNRRRQPDSKKKGADKRQGGAGEEQQANALSSVSPGAVIFSFSPTDAAQHSPEGRDGRGDEAATASRSSGAARTSDRGRSSRDVSRYRRTKNGRFNPPPSPPVYFLVDDLLPSTFSLLCKHAVLSAAFTRRLVCHDFYSASEFYISRPVCPTSSLFQAVTYRVCNNDIDSRYSLFEFEGLVDAVGTLCVTIGPQDTGVMANADGQDPSPPPSKRSREEALEASQTTAAEGHEVSPVLQNVYSLYSVVQSGFAPIEFFIAKSCYSKWVDQILSHETSSTTSASVRPDFRLAVVYVSALKNELRSLCERKEKPAGSDGGLHEFPPPAGKYLPYPFSTPRPSFEGLITILTQSILLGLERMAAMTNPPQRYRNLWTYLVLFATRDYAMLDPSTLLKGVSLFDLGQKARQEVLDYMSQLPVVLAFNASFQAVIQALDSPGGAVEQLDALLDQLCGYSAVPELPGSSDVPETGSCASQRPHSVFAFFKSLCGYSEEDERGDLVRTAKAWARLQDTRPDWVSSQAPTLLDAMVDSCIDSVPRLMKSSLAYQGKSYHYDLRLYDDKSFPAEARALIEMRQTGHPFYQLPSLAEKRRLLGTVIFDRLLTYRRIGESADYIRAQVGVEGGGDTPPLSDASLVDGSAAPGSSESVSEPQALRALGTAISALAKIQHLELLVGSTALCATIRDLEVSVSVNLEDSWDSDGSRQSTHCRNHSHGRAVGGSPTSPSGPSRNRGSGYPRRTPAPWPQTISMLLIPQCSCYFCNAVALDDNLGAGEDFYFTILLVKSDGVSESKAEASEGGAGRYHVDRDVDGVSGRQQSGPLRQSGYYYYDLDAVSADVHRLYSCTGECSRDVKLCTRDCKAYTVMSHLKVILRELSTHLRREGVRLASHSLAGVTIPGVLPPVRRQPLAEELLSIIKRRNRLAGGFPPSPGRYTKSKRNEAPRAESVSEAFRREAKSVAATLTSTLDSSLTSPLASPLVSSPAASAAGPSAFLPLDCVLDLFLHFLALPRFLRHNAARIRDAVGASLRSITDLFSDQGAHRIIFLTVQEYARWKESCAGHGRESGGKDAPAGGQERDSRKARAAPRGAELKLEESLVDFCRRVALSPQNHSALEKLASANPVRSDHGSRSLEASKVSLRHPQVHRPAARRPSKPIIPSAGSESSSGTNAAESFSSSNDSGIYEPPAQPQPLPGESRTHSEKARTKAQRIAESYVPRYHAASGASITYIYPIQTLVSGERALSRAWARHLMRPGDARRRALDLRDAELDFTESEGSVAETATADVGSAAEAVCGVETRGAREAAQTVKEESAIVDVATAPPAAELTGAAGVADINNIAAASAAAIAASPLPIVDALAFTKAEDAPVAAPPAIPVTSAAEPQAPKTEAAGDLQWPALSTTTAGDADVKAEPGTLGAVGDARDAGDAEMAASSGQGSPEESRLLDVVRAPGYPAVGRRQPSLICCQAEDVGDYSDPPAKEEQILAALDAQRSSVSLGRRVASPIELALKLYGTGQVQAAIQSAFMVGHGQQSYGEFRKKYWDGTVEVDYDRLPLNGLTLRISGLRGMEELRARMRRTPYAGSSAAGGGERKAPRTSTRAAGRGNGQRGPTFRLFYRIPVPARTRRLSDKFVKALSNFFDVPLALQTNSEFCRKHRDADFWAPDSDVDA